VHPAGWPEPVAVEDWLAALPLLYESFPDLRSEVRHATHADGVALVEATLTDPTPGRST